MQFGSSELSELNANEFMLHEVYCADATELGARAHSTCATSKSIRSQILFCACCMFY